MRIAVVSDIHGNRSAFEAVLNDLRRAAPDLVMHGGDLADSCSSPVDIVDRIRDLGWPGVVGNTDEMLFNPAAFEAFAACSPQLADLWSAIREIAAWTRQGLGEERLAWLRSLPRKRAQPPFTLVHASPNDCWRAPPPDAPAEELQKIFGGVSDSLVVHGHIHRPYIRKMAGVTIANSGSVGLPYDGDPRASYLLIDDGQPAIRRVEYDVQREIAALEGCGCPHAAWIISMLQAAAPRMP